MCGPYLRLYREIVYLFVASMSSRSNSEKRVVEPFSSGPAGQTKSWGFRSCIHAARLRRARQTQQRHKLPPTPLFSHFVSWWGNYRLHAGLVVHCWGKVLLTMWVPLSFVWRCHANTPASIYVDYQAVAVMASTAAAFNQSPTMHLGARNSFAATSQRLRLQLKYVSPLCSRSLSFSLSLIFSLPLVARTHIWKRTDRHTHLHIHMYIQTNIEPTYSRYFLHYERCWHACARWRKWPTSRAGRSVGGTASIAMQFGLGNLFGGGNKPSNKIVSLQEAGLIPDVRVCVYMWHKHKYIDIYINIYISLSICLYIHLCIYTYMYIIYTTIYMCIYVCKKKCKYIYICICLYTYICICMDTHKNTYIYIYVCIYTYLYICVCLYIHIHGCI